MADPHELQELALNTYVQYICDLIGKLIEPINPSSSWIQYVHEVDDKLLNLINRTQLSKSNYLTDYFTNKLLTAIDYSLFQVENKKCVNRLILTSLLYSIVQPAVTRIEPISDLLQCSDMCENAKFRSALLNSILATEMKFNGKLNVLQCLYCSREALDSEQFYSPLHNILNKRFTVLSKLSTSAWDEFEMNSSVLSQLKNLEDYQGYCNDELIQVMLKNCKNLKYLMITEGENVTDNSICSILKFKHLEYLNITNTDISPDGVSILLNGLLKEQGSSKLKSLYLREVYSDQFEILQQLPDLKIIVFSIQCFFHDSFSELKDVENIHGIHVSTYAEYLCDIVRTIGSCLVYLNVNINTIRAEQQESIMQAIGSCCTSLKCFHISSFLHHWEPTPDPDLKFPGFKSLTCLKYTEHGRVQIERSAESGLLHFLLVECVNLKKVTFTTYYNIEPKSDFLNSIFKFNLMKNVEEVYFCLIGCVRDYCNCEDDVKSSLLLVNNCLNLRVVGGLKVATVHHNSQRVKFFS